MKFSVRLTIVAVLVAIFLLAVSAVQGQGGIKACSKDGGAATFTVITNGTLKPIKYYWIDKDCNEKEYGTLEAGKTVVQPTFAGHVWMTRLADTGEPVGELIVPQSVEPMVVEVACSGKSDIQVNLTVVNTSAAQANLYWVDENCSEKPFATIDPGQSVVQPTYHTHVWVLRDAQTGQVLSRTRALALTTPLG